jgi:hypothetical protein
MTDESCDSKRSNFIAVSPSPWEVFVRKTSGLMRSTILRGLVYFSLWILLIGLDPPGLSVGVFATAVATWASLRLLAPGTHPMRLAPLPGLMRP